MNYHLPTFQLKKKENKTTFLKKVDKSLFVSGQIFNKT